MLGHSNGQLSELITPQLRLKNRTHNNCNALQTRSLRQLRVDRSELTIQMPFGYSQDLVMNDLIIL